MPEYAPPELARNLSTEAIDERLFEHFKPPLIEFPEPSYVAPGGEAALVTTDDLVEKMEAENRVLVAETKQEGMPTPRLRVIAGNVYGEQREHVISTALHYQRTGEIRAGFGDGMSYMLGSLAPAAAASDIDAQIIFSPEVGNHAATHALIQKAGLDPAKAIIIKPELGDLLADLGPLAEERQRLEDRLKRFRAVPFPSLPATDSELTGSSTIVTGSAPENFDSFTAQVETDLKAVNDAIDARLHEQDQKLRAIVTAENADEEVDAVLAIMPSYTCEGDQLIRDAMTDPLKDIDGLGSGERWDQITANAAIMVRDHLVRRFAGRAATKAGAVLLGLGKLVGYRVKELDEPGRVYDGRGPITEWVNNPGKEPVETLITATRANQNINARIIPAARWGKRFLGFMQRQRLLIIVDVGSVTQVDANGQRYTVGNLDPNTIPRGNRVKATGARHGVGPVTGRLAARRAILAAKERYYQKQQFVQPEAAVFDSEDLVAA